MTTLQYSITPLKVVLPSRADGDLRNCVIQSDASVDGCSFHPIDYAEGSGIGQAQSADGEIARSFPLSTVSGPQ